MRAFRDRPVDVLTTAMVAPLLDYMPGVRKGIVFDLPRKRLALSPHRALADAPARGRLWRRPDHAADLEIGAGAVPRRHPGAHRLRSAKCGSASSTTFAPGEKALPRMVDRCAALALPKGAALPADWPLPQLVVPAEEVPQWRERMGLTDARPRGRGGAGRRRPVEAVAGGLSPSWRASSLRRGYSVWVIGGPLEKALAAEIVAAAPSRCRDLTGSDLRNAILATGRGRCRDLQRLRPAPRRGGHRHAVDRHFRPDQPLALGAAQSARRGDRAQDRRAVPALPQADLPVRPPPLHARHPGRAGHGGGGGGSASGRLNCFDSKRDATTGHAQAHRHESPRPISAARSRRSSAPRAMQHSWAQVLADRRRV